MSPLCVAAGGAAGPRTPERVRRPQAAGPRRCLRCRGLLGCTDPGSARRLRRRHGAAGDQSALPPLATGQCPPPSTPKTTLQPFCRLEAPTPPLPSRLSSISPHPSTPTLPLSSPFQPPPHPSPHRSPCLTFPPLPPRIDGSALSEDWLPVCRLRTIAGRSGCGHVSWRSKASDRC